MTILHLFSLAGGNDSIGRDDLMGKDVLHVVEDDGRTCIGTFELDVDVAE